MTKKPTIIIAFPKGGKIPGAVLGKSDDQACAAMEQVSVPEAYGRHLIDDRFAVEVSAQEVGKSKKKVSAAAIGNGETDKDSAEVVAAKAAVVEAEQLVSASGSDMATKAEAEAMLKAAQHALAALQA